ncbi:cytochrome C oxidase subunit IV family protein, partial [Micromonospora sp. WMMD736]|uniref:cytochrome C oxidase subunit IV family protein n=1 Tax=Micromonospora sp. WMMD736 TaxID=3404112 RepID=UPI003B93C1E1
MTATARITYVWLALCALTIGSWLLAPAGPTHSLDASVPITIAVLAMAAVKCRLILSHFMEVRTAPGWLRIAVDGWLV